MVLPAEGLSAYVARVRPLVGVRPLVNQQVVALGELPIAELADELFLRPLARWPSREERRRLRRRRHREHARVTLVVQVGTLGTATPER